MRYLEEVESEYSKTQLCVEIAQEISDDRTELKNFCRDVVDFDDTISNEEYNELKSEALDELEVWGNASDYWFVLLPISSEKDRHIKEWKFVTANFLITSVKSGHIEDKFDSAIVSSAAKELFDELGIDRNKSLSESLNHSALGYMALEDEKYDVATQYFEEAVNIIQNTDKIGGWYFESVYLRDQGLAQAESYLEDYDLLEAISTLRKSRSDIESINSPTEERLLEQLNAKEYEIRVLMADEMDNEEKRKEHKQNRKDLLDEYGMPSDRDVWSGWDTHF